MSIEQRLAELERRVRELEARENLAFNATNITGGTLSTDRYSAYADLNAENRIGFRAGQLPPGQNVPARINVPQTEDFHDGIPPGWSWAGAPFVTPSAVAVSAWTYLEVVPGENARSFLVIPSTFSSYNIRKIVDFRIFASGDANTYAGIRYDDGTDNNYVECVLAGRGGDRTKAGAVIIWRLGGGTINSQAFDVINMQILLETWTFGTYWSNWIIVLDISNLAYLATNIVSGLTFTPTRAGLIFKSTYVWERFYLDGVNWT